MSNSSLEYSKKNKGKAKQYPRYKKERKFIWEQVVLHIHIPLYEYIYFYASLLLFRNSVAEIYGW